MVIKGNNLNAILNYAKLYSSVSKYLGTYDATALTTKDNIIAAGDYAKIFFTGDGHIISHGIDYTPTFGDPNHSSNPLAKGLVPASDFVEGQKIKFLGNKGSWHELTVDELPIAQNFSAGQPSNPDGDKVIYNAQLVYELFDKTISAIDVMRFKGEFDASAANHFADGKVEAGDTYRVSNGGKYAGFTLTAGDLLICIKDSDANTTADDLKNPDNKYWMVVESNIDGTTMHRINGTSHLVYTNNPDPSGLAFEIFAPKEGGTAGQVLISAGTSAPVWRNSSDLDLLSNDWKNKIVGTITVANNGNMEWKSLSGNSLGSYTPDITNHRWNINIAGKAAGTDFALTTSTGLSFADGVNFDGSADRQLVLTPATRTDIGGITVDSRTKDQNEKDFLYPDATISVNNGMIYLTKENVSNALGFVPGSTENVFSYANIVTSTIDGINPDTSTNPYFNLTATKENETVPKVNSSTQFVGTNGIKVDGQPGKIIFDLQEATTSTYGGIKIFKKNAEDVTADTSKGSSDLASRYYGVEVDKSGKAFVYVPWQDINPAFNKVNISGGDNGTSGTITAEDVNSSFTLSAGNGINLVLADPNNIIINQNVWEVVKADKMGYAPAMVKGEELTKGHYMLSFKEGDTTASWHKLPQAAFSDTWRAIQVNNDPVANTNAIDANGVVVGSALNFTATGAHNKTTLSYVQSTAANTPHIINISSSWRPVYEGVKEEALKLHDDYGIVFDATDSIALRRSKDDSAQVEIISFDLVWYNIDSKTAEIVI